MPDLLFILLTLACFAGLALLVGLIDRRLGRIAPVTDPVTDPDVDPDGPAAEATSASVPHDSSTTGAAR
ncbi:hypothetical protein FB381_3968 [Nocardioides albertanoniae]|uniref:Uncharacterized protein n=1 Tax=Nocardioides albertanoniae TaxID=1175486 RepID=A0A543ABS1_9ACTN|nr:hypothetical protein [Nocardioides albertanoniae]TQL70044.1 hypothetical protein FB381_3968 [Nocardioides albertanoniae]